MKLLFISESSSLGGAPNVMFHFIKEMQKYHHSIEVILTQEGKLKGKLLDIGIAPKCISYENIIPFFNTFQKIFIKPYYVINKLRNAIIKSEADIIIYNGLPSNLILSVLEKLNNPVVLHIHGLNHEQLHQTPAYIKTISGKQFHYVCCSKEVESKAINLLGLPTQKVYLVYNAINNTDTNHISERYVDGKKDNYNYILSGGSFSYNKGADLFVETAIEIIKKRGNYKFIWLGNIKEYEHIYSAQKCKIDSLGLNEYFIFPSQVDNPEVYINKANCVAMFSRAESFGMILLEGMRLSKPALAFNIGGMPEVIAEPNNVIAPFNIIDYANRIIAVCENNNTELLDKQDKHIDLNFDISKNTTRYLAILDTIQRNSNG